MTNTQAYCSTESTEVRKSYMPKARGLYYKILRTRNVLQIDRFRSKVVYCILSVTNTLALTNKLAYYGICKLRIRNVCKVQAPGGQPYTFCCIDTH
jgi:hypothetical protein